MNALPAIPEKRSVGCPPGQGVVLLPNGSRIGCPPHVPTTESRALVMRLAQTMPSSLIAEVLAIARSTLWLHYRQELADAKAALVEEFGQTLIQKIRAGNDDLLKFYLVRMGEWNETKQLEHTGAGGGPIQHVDVAQLAALYAGMNDDELDIADRLLAAIATHGGAGQPDGSDGSAAAIEGGTATPTP